MRILKAITALMVIIIFSVCSVSAHSGRTDSRGGHDSGDGYHYHHGYEAHLHTNGKCPFNFDDRTGLNSGISSGSSQSSSMKVDVTEKQQSSEGFSVRNFLVYSALVLLFGFWLLGSIFFLICDNPYLCYCLAFIVLELAPVIHYFFNIYYQTYAILCVALLPPALSFAGLRSRYSNSFDSNLAKLTEEYEQAQRIHRQDVVAMFRRLKHHETEKQKKIQFAREREEYSVLYGGKDLFLLAGMPDWLKVGTKGLPQPVSPEHDSKFYFCLRNKKRLHTLSCRYADGTRIDAITLRKEHFEKCMICNPELPDLSWYDEYFRIKKVKKDYNIE